MLTSSSLLMIGAQEFLDTEGFPKRELFSLIEQTRRGATSVGMNQMEGAMRLGGREYRQFGNR